ncbi:MAG: polysaccharide lyase domain-containing protein [Pirellulaceae bacterium]
MRGTAFGLTRWLISVCVLLMVEAWAQQGVAKEWYAAPDGKPVAEGGAGTMQSPWDLVTAMKHQEAIKPGDTVWFREGRYYIERVDNVADVVVELNGTAEKPIVFRAYPRERAKIDARIQLSHAAYGKHLVFWGLEFFTAEWMDWDRDKNKTPAPGPEGGINLLYGENVKVINCFMHSTAGPINAWNPVNGIELYGNVLFDNGYITNRYNGPAIYSQNRQDNPVRQIRDNLILDNYSHPLQIYGGSQAQVYNFHAEGNICKGREESNRRQIIFGGGGGPDNPSTNLHAVDNVFYMSGIQLGFGNGHGRKLSAVNNHIYRGQIVQAGNLSDVTVIDNWVWNQGDPVPSEPKVFVRQNKYEPNRLHVAVFKWGAGDEVAVDLSEYLKMGATFEVRDPKSFFGDALITREYAGDAVNVPVPGEFGAFIVVVKP